MTKEPGVRMIVLSAICVAFLCERVAGAGAVAVAAAQTNAAPGGAATDAVLHDDKGALANAQKYASGDGHTILVLNWKDRTFSRAIKEEGRAGSAAGTQDRVDIRGTSALGEAFKNKRERTRLSEGDFLVEGQTLVLNVKEGFCPRGKTSRMTFADDRRALIAEGETNSLRLISEPGK